MTGQIDKPRERRFIRWAFSWEVESDEAEDLKHLSVRNYWADREEDRDFKGARHSFLDGYGQVPQVLARGLDIRLGHKVQTITHDKTGVSLATSKGKFREIVPWSRCPWVCSRLTR